jgi:glycyl-tRNA synthetase beta chain
MAQLLLELFCEEIPARMQAGAARDLERLVRDKLAAHELAFESLHAFAGPRRLTLVIEGLPAATPDRSEELKGPKASAPPQALEGFLRKTGLSREQLSERDGVLYATLDRPGRPTPQIAAEAIGEICRSFPWPKSMRSGASSFRWVRPLKRIVFLFDGAVVPFELNGVAAANLTEGHRFMGARGAPFAVTDFADYRAKLEAEFVVLDAEDRKRRILAGARAACAAQGLELVEDEGLLDEVAGLAEWPTPLVGDMDPAFLDLPGEVIRTSMRTHQKYFATRPAGSDARGETALAPHFVVVANIEAIDGGDEIKRGNAKVLSARLSDARFFWDEDRKAGAFERWLGKLNGVTFHAKLGTMAERVERIAALAREIAPAVGADPDLAEIAARLAKADLASAMVGEFPELQGIMGGYYVRQAPYAHAASGAELLRASRHDGEEDPLSAVDSAAASADGQGAWWTGLSREQVNAVADAVRDHYKPAGPSDSVPTAPLTVAVALADKLDTLVGFFWVDEKPTGSKDPYALRRAALGGIRLLLTARCRIKMSSLLPKAFRDLPAYVLGSLEIISGDIPQHFSSKTRLLSGVEPAPAYGELLAFFADRLKVLLRDEGKRHDLVDAVFALGDDDLVRIVDRVEALSAFLASEDGANLLGGYKRAVNILRAEQKKNPAEAYDGAVNSAQLVAPEEQALAAAVVDAQAALKPLLAAEDFAAAMGQLARLRGPVDAFFEQVLVNDPDADVRMNRLRLLSSLRDAANRVADFSLIQG